MPGRENVIMRSDMSKVIVERPRWSGHGCGESPRGHLKNRWCKDPESAPHKEPIGRSYRQKHLNENLQPLVRFLRKHVGRPWDKVRSEISAQISCASAVQKHVLDHLKDFVRTDVVLRGNKVFVATYLDGLVPFVSRGMRLRFYVCPRTRLLRLAPVVPRKKPKK